MATVLTVVSLFPGYSVAGPGLAASSQAIWFNVPVIACLGASTVLLLHRRSAPAGAGLLVGGTTVGTALYVTTVGSVVHGTDATGADLGLAGLACAVMASTLVTWLGVRSGARLSAHWGGALWAMLAASVAVVWAVGDAANWVKATYAIPAGSGTFTATGTNMRSTSCCTPLSLVGWERSQAVAVLVLGVVVPIVAALWVPVRVGVAAIIGAALVTLSGVASEFATLSQPVLPITRSATATSQSYQVTTTLHGLPGLWVALVSAVVLLLVAVGRGLHAASR
jgi:hypothetical protein